MRNGEIVIFSKVLRVLQFNAKKPNNNKLVQSCRNFAIILPSWLKILWTS
jgi:hypothetical protein